jgi:hypothetical protein
MLGDELESMVDREMKEGRRVSMAALQGTSSETDLRKR